MDGYEGMLVVPCALRLAPLDLVRPGELRQAEWSDIDLEAAEWRCTVTKTGTRHPVPLSRQAVEILRELHPLTGHGRCVFPSARTPRGDRPMSENAILAALKPMGIGKEEMTGHGFRAMARTLLDEEVGFRPDVIEHQPAHVVRDPNGRAYNRTAHLPERRKMMQEWADYLGRRRPMQRHVAQSKFLNRSPCGHHYSASQLSGDYRHCTSSAFFHNNWNCSRYVVNTGEVVPVFQTGG